MSDAPTFHCDCHDITHALRVTPSYGDGGELENVFVTVASHPEGLRERIAAAWRALFHRESNIAELVLAGHQMHAFIAYCAHIRAGAVTYTAVIDGGSTTMEVTV